MFNAGLRRTCHSLQQLSLVRCVNLRSLSLGLQPSGGLPLPLAPHPRTASMLNGPDPFESVEWQPCEPLFTALTSLKVGLAGLQVLALALPALASLDSSSCLQLRSLHLRCPYLTSLSAQMCRSLAPGCLVEVVERPCSARLELLDAQHVPLGAGHVARIEQHPLLRTFLQCPANCIVCKGSR